MDQCKECGASLPEDFRFCPKCGTPRPEAEEKPAAPAPTPTPAKPLDFLRPAITGGLALGVLSAMPIIMIGNCCCCLWIQGGGALSTWLLDKQRPGRLQYGDGAFAGAISGLVGALVSTIISIPIQMLTFSEEQSAQFLAQIDQVGDFPPELRDWMAQMFTPGLNMSRTLFVLAINLVIYSLFAMIGGILTVAVLNRRVAQGVNRGSPS